MNMEKFNNRRINSRSLGHTFTTLVIWIISSLYRENIDTYNSMTISSEMRQIMIQETNIQCHCVNQPGNRRFPSLSTGYRRFPGCYTVLYHVNKETHQSSENHRNFSTESSSEVSLHLPKLVTRRLAPRYTQQAPTFSHQLTHRLNIVMCRADKGDKQCNVTFSNKESQFMTQVLNCLPTCRVHVPPTWNLQVQ